VSEQIGALSLQGPLSRAELQQAPAGPRERSSTSARRDRACAGIPGTVSRTGYTGDLGYEIWVGRARTR
jgi:aminomethyltransferase